MSLPSCYFEGYFCLSLSTRTQTKENHFIIIGYKKPQMLFKMGHFIFITQSIAFFVGYHYYILYQIRFLDKMLREQLFLYFSRVPLHLTQNCLQGVIVFMSVWLDFFQLLQFIWLTLERILRKIVFKKMLYIIWRVGPGEPNWFSWVTVGFKLLLMKVKNRKCPVIFGEKYCSSEWIHSFWLLSGVIIDKIKKDFCLCLVWERSTQQENLFRKHWHIPT